MKYLSVCSGIEAASVAWHHMGWEPLAFSEIEAFPRAVLAHHYPAVPVHGDFTKLRDEPWIIDADVLVGGTPCQAFSVAGLRNSLADDRGNLTLEYVRLADAIDDLRHAAGRQPAICVWENVPGVLSVKDNAFGCFLAALAGDAAPYVPPRGKWTDAGVVDGPARKVAWRILDAQYFGLAQRRRRVFVVASARERFDPAEVLFEFEGMQRHSPPSREAGEASAGSVVGSARERSHWDGVDNPHPTLNQSFNTGAIGYSNQELFSQRGAGLVEAFGGNDTRGAIDLAAALNANRGCHSPGDFESDTLLTVDVSPTLRAGGNKTGGDRPPGTDVDTADSLVVVSNDPAHAICANEQRTYTNEGSIFQLRNVVAQPVAVPLQEVGKRTGVSTDDPRAGIGIGQDGDPMFTLQAGAQHGVAAYAFQPRIARNGRGDMSEIVNALNAQSGETGKGDAAPCVAVADTLSVGANQTTGFHTEVTACSAMQVRRLTPEECEALQGFPRGYTLIPWRNKPAADCPDGPRYKALGNSMAVPCMRWIGQRINAEAVK